MAMKSSTMLGLCFLTFFISLIGFFIEPVSCNETEALSVDTATFYSDYCSSTVPESIPDYRYYPTYKFLGPFLEYETGYYYSGSGNRILSSNITRFLNSFSFHTRLVYRTEREGVFKIESSLVFQSPYYVGNTPYRSDISLRSPLNLKLQGFWSEPSGKLCMVGRGSAYSKEGKLLTPAAVLKLSNIKNFNSITTLITGTLVSVSLSNDKDYFEPVSLLMIPQLSYNYTFVSEEFVDGFSREIDNVQGLPYYNVQPTRGFCSIISTTGNVFNLQYTSSCSPEKSCLPFGGVVGYLPYVDFEVSWHLALRKTSSMVGQIWTNKTVNDSGYFNTIVFQSNENRVEGVPGLKYEYTEMERVDKSCLRKKPARNKGEIYPTGDNFIDMKFYMSLKSSEGKIGWGFAGPYSVGYRLYKQNLYAMGASPSSSPVRTALRGPVNISYAVGITLRPAPKVDGGVVLHNLTREKVDITAEGFYDADTGALCLVGCQKTGSNNQVSRNASVDCEILLNFQLPPLKPNKKGGYIKGSIERLQLYHVKKNPEVLSFTSLVMLVILTLGYIIPLVLNFEALLSNKQGQNSILVHSDGWLEVKEAIVRIITMVAFLLQFRLLQLAISARSDDENQRGLWFAEKITLLVTESIYVVGAFITMLANWGKHSPEVVYQRKNSHQVVWLSSHMVQYWQYSTWKDLKSYAGLISNGFLLPQILLNIFSNSRENTLRCSFYVGTSFIRLLPHVYDLYSNHSYIQLKGKCIFMNPSEGFFSTAWDVCIPLGVLLFAAIIYLQQRFGGRCILPGRFRVLKKYEKVPVICESRLQRNSSMLCAICSCY
ncbi:hypothetical protein CRYUN_Cryun11dG0034900 [Craigia yunnanensis]